MSIEPIGDKQPEKEPSMDPGQEAELRSLMPDFEPEKGKEKSGKTEKQPDKESLAMVSLLYAGVFGVLAARLGDHWNLQPAEVESLAVPTIAVIEKYYPSLKVGPEVALLSAVAMVVVPRLMVQVQMQAIDGESEEVPHGDKPEHPAQQ